MWKSCLDLIERNGKLFLIFAIVSAFVCVLTMSFINQVSNPIYKDYMIWTCSLSGLVFIITALPIGLSLGDGMSISATLPAKLHAEINIFRLLNTLNPGEKVDLEVNNLQIEDFIQLEQKVRNFEGYKLTLTDEGKLFLEYNSIN